MVKFSIIIPTYNRPEELDALLESIAKQTFKEFEVIVVEDGSKIKADKITEKYSQSLNIKYYFKKNEGPGLARNFGAEKADAKYLIFFFIL